MTAGSARAERPAVWPLAALAAITVVTVAWWGLALWPLPETAPGWVARTRALCFGSSGTGLPDAEGWIALTLQPTLMYGTLFMVWGGAVARGLQTLGRDKLGRAVLIVTAFALLTAGAAAGARVHDALGDAGPVSLGSELPPETYPRLDRPAPELGLVDQAGERITLDGLRGRPILVTFAFAHCRTVCPVVVNQALAARRRLGAIDPAIVVVTLDPWRDSPARLSHIAERWGLSGTDAHVLSGSVGEVNAVLDAWGVARRRDPATGDITHPPLVYVVDSAGTIAYAATGDAAALAALVRRLRAEPISNTRHPTPNGQVGSGSATTPDGSGAEG